MTFHRTAGKGGTRNSSRERHADRFLPNNNKRQGSGANPRGRVKHNPPAATKDTPGQRYKKMMGGERPRMSMGERWGSRRLGESDVTGDYGY